MKYQKLQSLARFMASESMKKSAKLLVSISLFSFLFSYSSLNFSFSTFPFQLLSHGLDKSYVFVICNGLLVLLAKTSREEEKEKEIDDETKKNFMQETESLCNSLHKGCSEFYRDDAYEASNELVGYKNEGIPPLEVEKSTLALVEYKQPSKERLDEEEKDQSQLLDVEEKEDGGEECSRNYIAEDDHDIENAKEYEDEFFIEENDEPLNKLSMEELNKKFEEFIRRMKEEIRIEATRQLVLVK